MVWIQSLICALLFVFNFAWHPANAGLAVALNIVLAASCATLLLTIGRSVTVVPVRGIRDDLVRNIIVALLILLYVVTSVAKWNGSSTALWRNLVDQQPPKAGLVAGTPKVIRSDEWLVHTPWILSQANQSPAFPITNRNVGNGVMPLLTNLPVRHWTMLFRPQMWGFFVFDLERAFAFNWNFKWFGILLGGFLFFRVIAPGNNFLALSGAFLVLYSSYIQWFFSTPTCMPEMVAMLFFGLWALSVLVRTASRWAMLGTGLVLLVAIEQFVFCCYPRFQIPLVYLALALAAAGMIAWRKRFNFDFFRIGTLLAVFLLAAIVLCRWYGEVSATIKEVEGLIYPGQTVSTGGSYSWSFFIAPFLEFSMTEQHFPTPLGNPCEAAGFFFVAPLLAIAVLRDAWRKRIDPLLLATVLFSAAAIYFMVFGVPLWLARATGWSHVVSIRVILAVGVASIIGLIRHLALPVSDKRQSRIFFLPVAAAIVALLLFGCFVTANRHLGNFANSVELTGSAIFFATSFVLIWKRFAIASCILLLVPCLYANSLVNPISRGLPGITKSRIYDWFAAVHRNDPGAPWLAIGNEDSRSCCLGQFIEATGASVVGSTRCMPDRQLIEALDPQNQFANVHNRYARICFIASNDAEPVFKLTSPDGYRVLLPLRAEWLERLGTGYIVVVDQPNLAVLEGFERVDEQRGFVLLRRVSR
jgi:hypothetical protein